MTDKIIIEGKYNQAIVYTSQIDDEVKKQIEDLLNESFVKGEHIAIMPDTHLGKGTVIGTTMTTHNKKVCPNLVGVDIGCGILVTQIDSNQLGDSDFKRLDRNIKQNIPTGRKVRLKASPFELIDKLSFDIPKRNRMRQSLGSLGGGNHFIEVAQDDDGLYYLLIHSGSRGFGHTISRHHQAIAENYCFPQEGPPKVNQKSLSYLEGDLLEDYLNDLEIAQIFASRNRQMMTDIILEKMGWIKLDQFDSVHNYIDPQTGILRKGATDAGLNKRLVIPLNMRDGGIIAVGKGNPDWNYSAPHGSGRRMSRSQARKNLDLNKFKTSMQGIYTSSVNEKTLDEAPMAYKTLEEISHNLHETLDPIQRLRTVYNFKG